MNTEKILGTGFSYPLRRSTTNNLLRLLKEMQKEIIHTKDDYLKFNLLFELEFKLFNLVKSKAEIANLGFTIASSQAVIGLFEDIFFRLFKNHKSIKRYRALFEFKQQLYNKYHLEMCAAYKKAETEYEV